VTTAFAATLRVLFLGAFYPCCAYADGLGMRKARKSKGKVVSCEFGGVKDF